MFNKHETKSLLIVGTVLAITIYGFSMENHDNLFLLAIACYAWVALIMSLLMRYNTTAFLEANPNELDEKQRDAQQTSGQKIIEIFGGSYGHTYQIIDMIMDGCIAVLLALSGWITAAIAFTVHIYFTQQFISRMTNLYQKQQEQENG